MNSVPQNVSQNAPQNMPQNDGDETPFERLADRFKLLSEPSRLQILSAICDRECNVSEICDRTGLNQANVSKHLQLLKRAGIVTCRRVGVCHYYRIIDAELLSLCGTPLSQLFQREEFTP